MIDMISNSQAASSAMGNRCPVLTRGQFMKSLRRMGAVFGVSYWHRRGHGAAIEEVRVALLGCLREPWVAEFGEPEALTAADAPLACLKCAECCPAVWRQHCRDGPIMCEGGLITHCIAQPRIVLRRVRMIIVQPGQAPVDG